MKPAASEIDVIVPVHNQRSLVLACIASVHAAQVKIPFELVVVDDASSDPELESWLRALAAAGRITLLTNVDNLGFTRSVNCGMRLHDARDVILLNSDTVVYDGWLDRLHQAAYSHLKVASVNPLSNASHIGSYPFRSAVGDVTFEIDDRQLSVLAATALLGQRVEVHTTVGFCMYIRREALDDIGLFDADHFPFGYGEESDFCYRARRVGWRHLVTGDVFVRHWEGQSFGARKTQLVAEMISVFGRLHPDLALRDQTFLERDPIRSLRETLDLARLKLMLREKTELACISSIDQGAASNPALVFDAAAGTLQLLVPRTDTMPNLPRFRLPKDIAAFNATLLRLGVVALTFADASVATKITERLRGRPVDLQLAAKIVVR